MRILGIDPGSIFTGYGLIDIEGNRLRYVDAGRWSLRRGEVPQRLHTLQTALSAFVQEARPDVAAVESVFVHQNPASALKLGQARGVILCTLAAHEVPIHEYPPATIKQTICGHGRAEKSQVNWMVQRLLNHKKDLSEDAADALAAAICLFHHAPSSQAPVVKA